MSYVDDHYAELVAEFEDPASRTRRRLRPVYGHMLEALWEIEQRGNSFFKELATPWDPLGGKSFEWGILPEQVPEFQAIEESWRRDLAGVQTRALEIYQPQLVPLGVDVDDYDEWCSDELGRCENPDEVVDRSWRGLVAGRSITNPDGLGAGPVPDAAMPAYLASQIEILRDHMAEYWNPWWLRLIKAIPEFAKAAGEAVVEGVESATGALRKGSDFMRLLPWALGGTLAVALFFRARRK